MIVQRKLDGVMDESSANQEILKSSPTPYVHITCEKSGSLHLEELGLMAGRLAGWLGDKIQKSKNFKACCSLKYLIFCFI